MTNKKSASQTLMTIAIVLIMIVPLALGAGYVFWASAADKDSGGYRFFAGLFGDRYDGAADPVFAYDSPYASARPINPNFKSPVYVLGDAILEDIPVTNFADRLPADAVRELYIPSGMRYYGIGLFVCYIDGEGKFSLQKTTTNAGLQMFDPTKPTIIFIHGMQYQNGAFSDESSSYLKPMIEAGYNVLLFRWSQLADEDLPMYIEPKLWGTTEDKANNLLGMRWRDIDNEYIEDDIPNASVSEIFGAYYLDFLSRFDYTGSILHMTGHSMGGQLVFAAASYLLAKEQEGLISPAFLPDKVTSFDPYIAPFLNEAYCAWLGHKISRPMFDATGAPVYYPNSATQQRYTSSLNVVADTAKALIDRGIACEFVPAFTGYVHLLMYSADVNDPAIKKLYDNTVSLKFRSDWVTDIVNDFNGFHGAGRDWYFRTALHGYFYDHAMQNPTDFAPSANIPLSYFYARTGISYAMQENMTPHNLDDDVIFAENIPYAQIAGFAFEDTNGNNSYDERLQARMAGVKVELYLRDGRQDKLVATAITDQAGFYSFDVPRLYANGFDLFFVRAIAPKGYEICGRGSSLLMMNNDINPTNNRSDYITLKHYKNLQIVNIGVVKEA